MNNFWTRTLTGTVFVAVMIGGIWWSYWSMAVLFFVIVVLGLWEFYSLIERKGFNPRKLLGVALGISVFSFFVTASRLMDHYIIAFGLGTLFLSVILVVTELFLRAENPFANIAFGFFGILYIAVPFALLTVPVCEGGLVSPYRYLPNSLLGYFFLLWANDTFAYLVGRGIGKTKLFERISPKKTWEGTIGGILCAQGIAYLLSIYFTELPLRDWMVVGAMVSVFGTLGDLVESMFKRSLGVKDSGTILPGHGGILDRFDGVFLSAPFVVTYIELMH